MAPGESQKEWLPKFATPNYTAGMVIIHPAQTDHWNQGINQTRRRSSTQHALIAESNLICAENGAQFIDAVRGKP